MAWISDAKLTVSHDHKKKLVNPKVTCKVHFSGMELCLMKNCREYNMFKLKCQLWGEDSFFTGADDFLYTYGKVYYFPDATPNSPESCTFTDTLGEGVLDEDWGQDEVYGSLILYNLFTGINYKKKTNVVSHHF